MSWGGLNPALTSWRAGIVLRFPRRGTQSDGGYADAAHGSTSQHQADADSTVDAFDCDVNFLGSSTASGNAREDAIAAAVKADFELDPRSQLWIHDRTISSRAIGPWRERDYAGPNPHDKHIHFETRQALEDDGRPWAMHNTDALIGWDTVTPEDIEKIAQRTAAILTPKLDQAVSAWDDAFGRGENRQAAGSVLIEIRDKVRTLVAPAPEEPPAT